MKVTGREIAEYEIEDNDHDPVFLTLGEVMLEAGPKGLRKLAKFFNECAQHMENNGIQDHFHFNGNAMTRPQIVIINKRVMKAWREEKARAEKAT